MEPPVCLRVIFPCPSQTAAPCSARPAGVSPALVCHRPWCVTGGRDCRGVTGAAAVPGAAQGSVLRSRREGGTEAGEGTDFPRKLLCPADTEPGTRVFWAVQADAAAPGQPWAWGASGGQDSPAGARGKSAKGIFSLLPPSTTPAKAANLWFLSQKLTKALLH